MLRNIQFLAKDKIISALESVSLESTQSWSCWKDLHFENRNNTSITWSPHKHGLFNSVIPSCKPLTKVHAEVATLKKEAVLRDTSQLWCIGPSYSAVEKVELGKLLLNEGFLWVGESSGLAASLDNLGLDHPTLKSFTIETVSDLSQLKRWATLSAEVFELPSNIHGPWLALHEKMHTLSSQWTHFLGTSEGKDVACASVFHASQSCLLSHVGCLKSHRKNGFGSSITLRALWTGKNSGYESVVTNSTHEAYSLLRKLNFTDYGTSEYYLWLNE